MLSLYKNKTGFCRLQPISVIIGHKNALKKFDRIQGKQMNSMKTMMLSPWIQKASIVNNHKLNEGKYVCMTSCPKREM